MRAPTELAEAMYSRETMLADGLLSRPQTEGRMALITSLALNRVELDGQEAEMLLAERAAILQRCLDDGVAVEDVVHASTSDIETVLTDPTITDICLIGEGSVGSIYVRADKQEPRSGIAFDWGDVARGADHLKTGHIYQRMCSGMGFGPIAWGTFAAANIRRIWISDEESFEPISHDHPRQGLSLAYDDEFLTHDTLYKFKTKLRSRRSSALTTGVI